MLLKNSAANAEPNCNKRTDTFGVILLTEYHASSIRLWRVLLLRSDIRLAPSDIRGSRSERRELLGRIEYH